MAFFCSILTQGYNVWLHWRGKLFLPIMRSLSKTLAAETRGMLGGAAGIDMARLKTGILNGRNAHTCTTTMWKE